MHIDRIHWTEVRVVSDLTSLPPQPPNEPTSATVEGFLINVDQRSL